MRESGYYPPGAEFDPSAPYNEVSLPEEDFDVCVSQTLSKTTTITTNDYQPEICEEDGHRYIYTDDTNWTQAYEDQGSLTPLKLIGILKEKLEEELEREENPRKKRRLKFLIEECEGWEEDEYVITP